MIDKAEFLRILEEGGDAKGAGARFNWVEMLTELRKKTEPFTKAQAAEEFGANVKYTYSHLRDWVQEGKLLKINYGGMNVYLSPLQAEE